VTSAKLTALILNLDLNLKYKVTSAFHHTRPHPPQNNTHYTNRTPIAHHTAQHKQPLRLTPGTPSQGYIPLTSTAKVSSTLEARAIIRSVNKSSGSKTLQPDNGIKQKTKESRH
jgi:hypothetical protein